MGRVALWLEAHTGRIIAGIVTTSAGICVWSGVKYVGVGLLMVTSYALGSAWDADTNGHHDG
jgi:hypothetical protein